jgi:hypothetical protein
MGLLALFLSGICVGGLGTWMIAEQRVLETLTHEPQPFHKAIMRKLTRELDLSESQRVRIAEIVSNSQGELASLRERIRPEREEILRRGREALKAELSPEQQNKFDEVYRRMEERRSRMGHGRHGSQRRE